MDLFTFYQDYLKQYNSDYIRYKQRFMIVVYLRLITFLILISTTYLFWGNLNTVLLFISFGLIFFIFLVTKSTKLNYKKQYYKQLIEITNKELQALTGIYDQFDEGLKYVDPNHKYSYDIDLFGPGSFYQYINRTVTTEGANLLAKGLSYAGDKSDILNRQVAINELSKNTKWIHSFLATGSIINTDLTDQYTVNWLHQYKTIISKKSKLFLWIFPVISFLTIGLVIFSIIPSLYLYINLFFGIGISSIYLKKINAVHEISSKITDTLRQYARLLVLIENKSFESDLLQKYSNDIIQNQSTASTILNKLYKIFNSLDSRSNILISIILNGFFLKDMFVIQQLDRWILKYNLKAESWFHAIYRYDELISCANYNFNHPSYTFPKIIENNNVVEAEQMGHPLIEDSKRVSNDFQIKNGDFTIITGANMAGKSTFLRALGLNIAMANNGMPVCASAMRYKPISIISSMRTTDSLNKEESYFFSELKRLKFIVNSCENEPHLIILDEILKGTNSKDKAEGSWKFLERMRPSGSTGIIATHDLSLCLLSSTYKEFKNQCFDAEIINDELFFDYKLKSGQCKNMNASFLLKKMDII